MTKEEMHDRINVLFGKDVTYKFMGHDMLPFDHRTKDVEIIPGYMLHEFLSRNVVKSNTWINVKLLAELDEIHKQSGVRFEIAQTSLYKYEPPLYDNETIGYLKWHWQGHAVDIVPPSRSYLENRELYKTIRKMRRRGCSAFYDDHIHLDVITPRNVDFRTKKAPSLIKEL